MSTASGARIGSDIGGTFTDIVLLDASGAIHIEKRLTTPQAPDDAVVAGANRLVETLPMRETGVSQMVHATTLFTNALIERRGAPTALVTTRGFRDAIEIAREHRYDMYDLRIERAVPLAPRHLRFELDERVLADGSVDRVLNEQEVRELAARLRAAEVEAVAVSLIHAYRNHAHEARVVEILAAELPDVELTSAAALVPEIGEFERTSTALANAYVKRIANLYLIRLAQRLAALLPPDGPIFVMQSNGGLCDIATAREAPIRLLESGPAAGALAAAHIGATIGRTELLSFDMGGTTAKACIISEGDPLFTGEFEVDRRYLFKKGSGLPIKIPVVDLIEIGTGGGSLAGVDELGRLCVGPQSAGSSPGPACYDRGGERPTITDANLVLGYLDADFFLGGRMKLNPEKAMDAIGRCVADRLDLSVADAAWGIHRLANENMASAARLHSIERGKDIAELSMFAFGGAGPIHAFGICQILGSKQVLYPLRAGVMSAIGLLAAPLRFDFVRTLHATLEDTTGATVDDLFRGMQGDGECALAKANAASAAEFLKFADMRYASQGYDLRVRVPDGSFDEAARSELRKRFEAEYQAIYGHTIQDATVEVSAWRLVAIGRIETVVTKRLEPASRDPVPKSTRKAYLPDQGIFANVPVYDRGHLRAGHRLSGPAIIEEHESTAIINGAADIRVDDFGVIIVDRKTTGG